MQMLKRYTYLRAEDLVDTKENKSQLFRWLMGFIGLCWAGIWWLRVELNHRPTGYESVALTI